MVHKFVLTLVMLHMLLQLAAKILEDTVHMVIHAQLVRFRMAVHMHIVCVNMEVLHTLMVILIIKIHVNLEKLPVRRMDVVALYLPHLEDLEVQEVQEVPVELAELAV